MNTTWGDVMGVGASLHAKRIDDVLKKFICSLLTSSTTEDLSDAGYPIQVYIQRWQPEVDACLEVLFSLLSIKKDASPGMKTFGFVYSKQGNYFKLAFAIIFKWIYCRLRRISIHKNWGNEMDETFKKKMWQAVRLLDAISKSKLYPDLMSRVSGFAWERNFTNSKNAFIGVNKTEGQLMMRHLAWDAIKGLAMAIALLFDWNDLCIYAKHYAIDVYYQCLRHLKNGITHLPPSWQAFFSKYNDNNHSNSGAIACGICGLQPPEAPHVGGCSHQFCFYCLSKVNHISRFRCPICGVLLSSCTRADTKKSITK